MKKECILLMILSSCLFAVNGYASDAVESRLMSYQQQGAAAVDTDLGMKLWYQKNGKRSCSSCHAGSPQREGRHLKTGKLIKPMAPSVNPERYQDSRKIDKWFLRNCKWTLGRECSAQEKANILSWLDSQ